MFCCVCVRVTVLVSQLRLRDADEMVFNRPVLKHGPRSLTYMRVFGWKTLVRNESKGQLTVSEVGISAREALSTDRSLVKDLSKSISVGTRKMVIYA